jgi:hypothetical protein
MTDVVLLGQLVDERVDLVGAQHVRVVEAIGQFDGGDAAARDEGIDAERAVRIELRTASSITESVRRPERSASTSATGPPVRFSARAAFERERRRAGAALGVDEDDDRSSSLA